MNSVEKFEHHCRELPIIAILRGIQPHEVLPVATVLIDAGIRIIEIPLNSPAAYRSIEMLTQTFKHHALCGAGTVIDPIQLTKLQETGAELVVTPNCNPALIRHAVNCGFAVLPGFMTATEMFQAINAGANTLKFFPALPGSEALLGALKSVAPPEISFFPTGGIQIENMNLFRQAGARGFGIGSALYKPGLSPAEIANRAKKFVIQLKSLV